MATDQSSGQTVQHFEQLEHDIPGLQTSLHTNSEGSVNNYFYMTNSSVNISENNHGSRRYNEACRKIKESTKEYLDHLEWHNFVKTCAYHEARDRLKQLKIVILVGRQGIGKTTTASFVLKSLTRTGQPLILRDPSEWDLIPQHPRKIVNVLVDNMFGFDNIHPYLKEGWLQKFDLIYNRAMYGRVCVLLVLRTDLYSECQEQLKRFRLFAHAHILDLTERKYQLTREEMLEIAKCCMKGKQIDVKGAELKLHDMSKLSFPQICAFYVRSRKAQERGLQIYLENPVECITEELQLLKEQHKMKYTILVLVMILRGQLSQQFFYQDETVKEKLDVLRRLRKFIPFSSENTGNLESTANSLVGVFLSFSPRDRTYSFIHPVISDALLLTFQDFHIKDIIDICPVTFLTMYTKIVRYSHTDRTLAIRAGREEFIQLAKRIAFELTKGNYLAVLGHDALKDKPFVQCLTKEILKYEGCRQIHRRYVGFFTVHKTAYYCFAEESWVFRIPCVSGESIVSEYKRWKCTYKNLLCLIVMENLEDLALMVIKLMSNYFDKRLLHCACFMGFYPLVKLLLDNTQTDSYEARQILRTTIASQKESAPLIKLLLKKFKSACDPDTYVYEPKKYYFMTLLLSARLAIVHQKVKYLDELLMALKESNNYANTVSDLCNQLLVQFREGYFIANVGKFHQQKDVYVQMLQSLLKTGSLKNPGKMIYLAAQHHSSEALTILLNSLSYEEYVTGQHDGNWEIPLQRKGRFNISFHIRKERTALLEASERCIDSVKVLLQHGANVFAEDETGCCVLHSALIYSDLSLLQNILNKRQFNICEISDDTGVTPLHVAADYGSFECFQLLLSCYSVVNMKTQSGSTVLHKAILSEHDKCEKVEALLEKGADIHIEDEDGNTALHLTAVGKRRNIVSKLIQLGANINQRNKNGDTPLHIALSDVSTKFCVQILLEKGADVLAVNSKGVAPIYQAVYSASIDMMSLCLEHCPSNHSDISSLNPHPLAASPDLEKIKLLFRKGFCQSPQNAQDCLMALAKFHFPKPSGIDRIVDKEIKTSKASLFRIFCLVNNEEMMDKDWYAEIVDLMCREGACVNKPMSDGSTLFQGAVRSSNTKMAKVLLEKGANCNSLKSDVIIYRIDYKIWQSLMLKGLRPDQKSNENSILPHIARCGYWKTLELLLKHGYDVNSKSCWGSTALHESVNFWRCLQVLIKQSNLNINSQDSDGQTALHLMVEKDKGEDKIVLLLDHNADPNIADTDGNTPLLTACKQIPRLKETKVSTSRKAVEEKLNGDVITTRERNDQRKKATVTVGNSYDIFKVLLSHRANGQIQDRDGNAALHIAVKQNNFDLLSTLLQGGCEINVTDIHGNTPLNLLLRTRIVENKDIPMERSSADEQSEDMSHRDQYALDTEVIQTLDKPVNTGKTRVWILVKYLTENGADPNVENDDGTTPLHYASVTDCLRTVELLIDAGASVDAKDRNNRTSLHTVALCGHTRIARVLIDSEGDINAADRNGDIPLHIAVRKKRYNLVKLLVEKGADLEMRNDAGENGFDLCVQLENSSSHCWWIHKGQKMLNMLDPARNVIS